MRQISEIAEKTVHILLLDDHALFRESVARLLAAERGFEISHHCGTVQEALQILRKQTIDVVLLDFDLGEHDGREFIRLAKAEGFTGKVLLVTAGVEQFAATELIRSGISGVFFKRDSSELLARGIRDVMAGKVWLNQEQLQAAVRTEIGTSQQTRTNRFTQREQQVLSGVFEGLANKEIAVQVGVSESSVKATLQQLFSKTGVRTRSQLVRIVLEQYRDQL
jgi:two-component system, NarL family, nitrate/nitrite response regulator NarL